MVTVHLLGGRDGCKVADKKVKGRSSCFTCPFPKECLYEDARAGIPKGKQLRIERNESIRADLKIGMTKEEAMAKYNLSKRTIENAKKEVYVAVIKAGIRVLLKLEGGFTKWLNHQ